MATGLETRAVAAAEIDVEATSWVDAVGKAAGLLVTSGAATASYVDECVNLVREQGPYIAIAPGIALAHARPQDGARALGLTLVRLRTPVFFGHPSNDPVDLVFAFASPNTNDHIGLLAALARGLSSRLVEDLRCAPTKEAATALRQEVVDDAE
jgi:PTS system ascorbate-specific IIA component